MKKQEKALGYAASTVKSEDLNAAKSGSVMSGLTGKVAGLNITSGGATGSSQKVIVRGISLSVLINLCMWWMVCLL